MNFGPKMSESPQFSLVESILRPFWGRICHQTADTRPNTAASGRISGQERDFMNPQSLQRRSCWSGSRLSPPTWRAVKSRTWPTQPCVLLEWLWLRWRSHTAISICCCQRMGPSNSELHHGVKGCSLELGRRLMRNAYPFHWDSSSVCICEGLTLKPAP